MPGTDVSAVIMVGNRVMSVGWNFPDTLVSGGFCGSALGSTTGGAAVGPAVGQCRHRVEVGDAFEVMQRLVDRRRRFDLVIVDPPSFASKQRDRDGALAAYERLAELGVALTETGGLFVQSSCSSRITSEEFRSVVLSAGGTSSAEVVTRTETAHGIDHPIGFPQGAYLKTLFAEVRRTR